MKTQDFFVFDPVRAPAPSGLLVAAVLLCAGLAHGRALLNPDSNPGHGTHVFPKGDPVPDPPAPAWNYTLLPGSQLTDDCPVCDRLPIVVPMRGTFKLRLIEEDPLFATYAIEDLTFEAGEPPGATYKVRGSGVYLVGGEVALVQDLSLEAQIDNGWSNTLCHFTNASPAIIRGWPLLQITLDQTNGTDFLQYRLELTAAPVREIWFSTVHGFTPGTGPTSNRYVNAGDLVASTGRVVKRNQDLTGKLGLMPSPDPPDLGLDALDILPGGEVAFSLEQDAFSETLGSLQHGDLLTSRGRLLARNQELTSAFAIQPPVPDVGLDAVQVLDTGEILFSIETEVFSSTAGLLRPGDLLSNKGRVVKNREELLARFHPPPIPTDFGLDAFHVWPSGEVWFSLQEGFRDDVLGDLWPGDLLSDRGELLSRNRDLLREFQPLEDLADFGLDALFVVSDATAWPEPPRCLALRVGSEGEDVALDFECPGRVFQLEKATHILGPWLPFGPLGLELEFTDSGARTNSAQAFYRLLQW